MLTYNIFGKHVNRKRLLEGNWTLEHFLPFASILDLT